MTSDRDALRTFNAHGQAFACHALSALEEKHGFTLATRPYCLRVLLENVLRNVGVNDIGEEDVRRLIAWSPAADEIIPVPFHPARVLMQDYTGIPTLVDLAAMRDAMVARGREAGDVNPQIPVDLVIDHSLIVDEAGHAGAMSLNLVHEFRRNAERYQLAKWAQSAFQGIRVVPPGKGILHQVNIEHIATLVRTQQQADGTVLAYPDTMVGTDSHSTMVNGIGVLGWGVGGIEAEAAMLGLPLVVPLGRIVGVRLTGMVREGVTATDIVLTLTQRLRAVGVVDAFVEFYGPSAGRLSVADRATLANMSPEFGSTCGFFPIDRATIDYLKLTGRSPEQVQLVEAYARQQQLWRDDEAPEPEYSHVVEFDLGTVEPSVAGPRRPQDRVALPQVAENFRLQMKSEPAGVREGIDNGSVVLAAITSCTNTSNPAVMIGAGLLARKAVQHGLTSKPWVKTSLTPGSRVVSGYLEATGLQADLDRLGFHVAGYGCATCGGNSGQLDPKIEEEILARQAVAVAVLSGNRNFEARIHPLAKANYLMSPPLVIAYALAGTVDIDLTHDPIGTGTDGQPVFLKDIWPSSQEILGVLSQAVTPELFRKYYADLFAGDAVWNALEASRGQLFPWQPASTYIRRPPYFDDHTDRTDAVSVIEGARPLLLLGDSITTDHISPVGDIAASSPAGQLLSSHQVAQRDFNAYGSRRANHEVMVRGTFANIRLRNEIVPGVEGGFTRHVPTGEILPVFDAATRYAEEGVPLVIIAGREYGCGSSRDWAAKGTRLLGVRAVMAESFERIHRSNLIAMGVLPLQFPEGVTRATLGLDGSERIDLHGFEGWTKPGETLTARITRADGTVLSVEMRGRLDTANELKVWRAGGILPFVFRRLLEDGAQEGKADVA
ncbi:aconitate hydratase AcnA [Ancylobacter oerskovii]|uniref:Aconitate hydratase n=1 Tax=Ancylobacter oerskovii TaxID=459519 RepID=A0ABW4Z0H2_9HYPH|nr:aconitate hydratase AcnA [Ancylobacter oerskovii]MBS7542808.1 aconitate hydratase AcnA [Ancylobacter oerskovii]